MSTCQRSGESISTHAVLETLTEHLQVDRLELAEPEVDLRMQCSAII